MAFFDDLIPQSAGQGAPQDTSAVQRLTVRPIPGGFGDAISSVESDGRYDALGPVTRTGDRAYGKYQVMGANIGPWSEEVLGRRVTPQEFVANPQLQDQIFNAKFGSYVQKYGPENAAKAWFAGERGMRDPNRRDMLGTTVAQYANKFKAARGAAAAAPAAASGGFFDDLVPKEGTAPAPAGPSDMGGYTPEQVPQSASDVGQFTAGMRGAIQGLTANFGDELAGLDAAAGPLGGTFLAPFVAGARLGYEGLAGRGSATKAYEQARDKARSDVAQAEAQYPGTTLAGQVGGAIVLPGGAAIRGATLPARIASGAAVGAGYGAAAGAGEGTGAGDRASRAASGAALGGAVGAVAPPLLAGLGKVAGAITSPLRGVRNVEGEAARRVGSALERDKGTGGLSRAEFDAARAQDKPVSILDMGGSTTQSLGRSAANTSPEARSAIERMTDDRYTAQGDRLVDFLTGLVQTPANAGITREALEKAARVSRSPFYKAAYSKGAGGIWDQELSDLSQAPAIQDAVKAAIKQAENRAASGRHGPFLSPDKKPTLEFWDLVKRQLDDKISVARRAGEKETAMEYDQLRRILLQKLDQAVPEYEVARGVAASFFKANDALEAGEKFVTERFAIHEAARALAKMTPEERMLFQEGFISRYVELIQKLPDRRTVLSQIGQSNDARARLNLVLGKSGADNINAFLRIEKIMDRARGMLSNSSTARQLHELAMAGATNPITLGAAAGSATSVASGNLGPGDILAGALVGAARRGQIKIDERIARKVGEYLASSDPKMLEKAIAMAARQPAVMRALQAFDNQLGRISGQQGTQVAPLQSLGIGRAQDDQPNIPGPPAQ